MSILFEGEKNTSLDVKLSIVFYDSKLNKEQVHQINLNSKKLISISEGINHYRLAIRVSGTGQLNLSNIAISGEGFWLTQKMKEIRKYTPKTDYTFDLDKSTLFGFDHKRNRLLYHKNQNIIESRLIGKQYFFLSCLEDIKINEAPKSSLFNLKKTIIMNFTLKAIRLGIRI